MLRSSGCSPEDWQRFVTYAKNTPWFMRCRLCINSSYQRGGAATAPASTWAAMFAPSQCAAGCCLPAPSLPVPAAVGSTEPWRLEETPASTPSQPSMLGSKPSVKWQWEKRDIFFPRVAHSQSQPWAFHRPVRWVVAREQQSLDLPLRAGRAVPRSEHAGAEEWRMLNQTQGTAGVALAVG